MRSLTPGDDVLMWIPQAAETQKPRSRNYRTPLPLWYISLSSLPGCKPLLVISRATDGFSPLYFPSNLISFFIFTPLCSSTSWLTSLWLVLFLVSALFSRQPRIQDYSSCSICMIFTIFKFLRCIDRWWWWYWFVASTYIMSIVSVLCSLLVLNWSSI